MIGLSLSLTSVVLQARVRWNPLTFTEAFDNVAWSKAATTINPDLFAAPDGTQTADEAASTGSDLLSRAVTVASGSTQTFSLHMQRGNHDWTRLTILNGANEVRAWFNLATGAKGTANVAGTGVLSDYDIVDAGGGWYRCWLTGSIPGVTSYTIANASTTGDNVFTRVASGARRLWGAQINAGPLAPYQRVGATF